MCFRYCSVCGSEFSSLEEKNAHGDCRRIRFNLNESLASTYYNPRTNNSLGLDSGEQRNRWYMYQFLDEETVPTHDIVGGFNTSSISSLTDMSKCNVNGCTFEGRGNSDKAKENNLAIHRKLGRCGPDFVANMKKNNNKKKDKQPAQPAAGPSNAGPSMQPPARQFDTTTRSVNTVSKGIRLHEMPNTRFKALDQVDLKAKTAKKIEAIDFTGVEKAGFVFLRAFCVECVVQEEQEGTLFKVAFVAVDEDVDDTPTDFDQIWVLAKAEHKTQNVSKRIVCALPLRDGQPPKNGKIYWGYEAVQGYIGTTQTDVAKINVTIQRKIWCLGHGGAEPLTVTKRS